MSIRNKAKFFTDNWNENDWCDCGDEAIYKINGEWICDFCYWFYHVEKLGKITTRSERLDLIKKRAELE